MNFLPSSFNSLVIKQNVSVKNGGFKVEFSKTTFHGSFGCEKSAVKPRKQEVFC